MQIVVATDLSIRSDRAVSRAFHVARNHGAELNVLHVLDDDVPLDVSEAVQDKAKTLLERHCSSLAQGVSYKIDIRSGDPTEQLLKSGAACDLLILGVHRPRNFLDGLRETTMSRVVRHLATPVLLVTDRDDHEYENVIAACDFSPAAKAALEMAHLLAPQAKLTPLHALHVPYSGLIGGKGDLEKSFTEEALATAKPWLASLDIPQANLNALRTEVGGPLAVLTKLVREEQIDLISVGAHGRIGARPAFLGSLASDIVREPPCDVLIAR